MSVDLQNLFTDPRTVCHQNAENLDEKTLETQSEIACEEIESSSISNDEKLKVQEEQSDPFAFRTGPFPPRPPTPPRICRTTSADQVFSRSDGFCAPSHFLSDVVTGTLPFVKILKQTDVEQFQEACETAYSHRNFFVPDLDSMRLTSEKNKRHRQHSTQVLLSQRRTLRLAGALQRLRDFAASLSTLEDDIATVAGVGCTLSLIEGDVREDKQHSTTDTTKSNDAAPEHSQKRKFCCHTKNENQETEPNNKRRN